MRKILIIGAIVSLCGTPLHAASWWQVFGTGTVVDVKAALASGIGANDLDPSGWTPLMRAAYSNSDPDVIATLVQAGADVTYRATGGRTALIAAASNSKNPLVVAALLKFGAHIDDRNANGWTPILLAAAYNPNPGVITVLINAGASVEERTEEGFTPLIVAAFSTDNPEVMTTLLDAGARAIDVDRFGMYALDYASNNPQVYGTDAYQELSMKTRAQ